MKKIEEYNKNMKILMFNINSIIGDMTFTYWLIN